MNELFNGVGYGNVFEDGDAIIITSVDAVVGVSDILGKILEMMLKDMSAIINVPSYQIISDYIDESGANIAHEAMCSVAKAKAEKRGNVFEYSTWTREAINELLKDM